MSDVLTKEEANQIIAEMVEEFRPIIEKTPEIKKLVAKNKNQDSWNKLIVNWYGYVITMQILSESKDPDEKIIHDMCKAKALYTYNYFEKTDENLNKLLVSIFNQNFGKWLAEYNKAKKKEA